MTTSLDPQAGLGPFLQLTADSVVELLGFRACQVGVLSAKVSAPVAAAGADLPDGVAVVEELLTEADGTTIGWLRALPGTLAPTQAHLALLRGHARQAETAIRVSLAVRRDVDQIRAADASRAAVRRLAASPHVSAAWPEIVEMIATAYQADDVVVHSLNLDGSASVIATRQAAHPDSATLDFLTAAARSAWQRREAETFRFDAAATAGLSGHNRAAVQQWSHAAGLDGALLVPIGATEECLGALLISRRGGGPAWAQAEIRGATALGADLGLVLSSRRTLETQGRYLDELQAIDDYQDDLLGTVTTMLRSPMRRIGERIDVVGGDEPAAASAGVELTEAVKEMTTLVDDLLFFSRVTDPRRSRAADVINVATLARSIADRVLGQTDAISLRVRSSGAFPLVRGDETELAQLLTVVISNAVQYTAQGSVTVTIASGATEAEITVADTGSGIAAEDLGYVFDEFFRGANSVGIPGNGLGLAIAARVAEHHGGRIDLTSTPGVGTTVRLHLPLA